MRVPSSVWHVTREYAGLAEAGGVKDVVRGLADALVDRGIPTTVVMPLYGFLSRNVDRGTVATSFTVSLPDQDKGNQLFDEPVAVHRSQLDGVRLLLVESPRFSALRDVYTYTTQDETENHWRKKGTGHWDSHQLNMLLQRAALESAARLDSGEVLFHCHDGHTAFLPALMRVLASFAERFSSSASVVTIHNAGKGYHQEVWSPEFAALLTGLPRSVLDKGLLGGAVDPLLLAGSYSFLCTVSEQYAKELLAEKDAEVSGGLGKACRERGITLAGITNGIDPSPWDPRFPERSGLPARFDPSNGDLAGKRRCRESLEGSLGLPAPAAGQRLPLYAFVGRLTEQKGVDILFSSLKEALSQDNSPLFVVLGSGEKHREDMFAQLASQSRGKLSFVPRYDPELAKLIYAGSDFFLIPSEFEPCGLTDFISQLLGSIPIVHHVGGLFKVRDGETGFAYQEQSPSALSAVLRRTADLFAFDPMALERIRTRSFTEIFSAHTWDRVLVDGYLPFYEKALEGASWTPR